MLVKDIKPIGKFGKNFLKTDDANELIEKIIEKPLQKACKDCKNKNIETLMSTANRNNIVKKNKKAVNKKDVLEQIARQEKMVTLAEAGKGYAWLLINYNTLSDENREIFFELEKELGEETIWFVKSTYIQNLNKIRARFRLKPIEEEIFNDKYVATFTERQIPLMYNIRYPLRTICVRMPVEESTTSEDVESFFDRVVLKLVKQ